MLCFSTLYLISPKFTIPKLHAHFLDTLEQGCSTPGSRSCPQAWKFGSGRLAVPLFHLPSSGPAKSPGPYALDQSAIPLQRASKGQHEAPGGLGRGSTRTQSQHTGIGVPGSGGPIPEHRVRRGSAKTQVPLPGLRAGKWWCQAEDPILARGALSSLWGPVPLI